MFYIVLLAITSLSCASCIKATTWIELSPISSVQQAIEDGKPHEEIKNLVQREEVTTEDLKKAVKLDRPEIAHLLLNNGAIPDQETILFCTKQCQNLRSKNRARWWLLHNWLHSVKDASEKKRSYEKNIHSTHFNTG